MNDLQSPEARDGEAALPRQPILDTVCERAEEIVARDLSGSRRRLVQSAMHAHFLRGKAEGRRAAVGWSAFVAILASLVIAAAWHAFSLDAEARRREVAEARHERDLMMAICIESRPESSTESSATSPADADDARR